MSSLPCTSTLSIHLTFVAWKARIDKTEGDEQVTTLREEESIDGVVMTRDR